MKRLGVILLLALCQWTSTAQAQTKSKELKPTKSSLIKLLGSDFNIHIDEEEIENSLFDETFLGFLYTYFQTIHYASDLETVLTVSHRKKDIYDLVKAEKTRDEFIVSFSPYAKDRTSPEVFAQYQAYLKKKGGYLTNDQYYEFNNELFNQLNHIFLTAESSRFYLMREYGIETTVNLSDDDADMQEELEQREMLILLKQLKDIPPSVLNRMQLSRIVAMKVGYYFKNKEGVEDPAITATYNSYTHTMRILQESLYDLEKHQGEDTMLHEMGHSVWDGLTTEEKNSYLKISWEYKTKGWTTKAGNTEFVSTYSASEAKEDFPEHFASYLFNSRELFQRAPLKYAWLKTNIFSNFEYVDLVATNLKVYIESEHPDTKAPWIQNPQSQFMKLKILSSTSEAITFQSDVFGLYDDVSGISKVDAILISDDGPYLDVIYFAAVKNEPGHFQSTVSISKSQIPFNTKAFFSNLGARDNAGNSVDFGGSSNSVPVSGTYVRPKPPVSIQTTISNSPGVFAATVVKRTWDANGDMILQMNLNVAHPSNLYRASVGLLSENENRIATYDINRHSFNSKAGDPTIRFSIRIPAQVSTQIFTFKSVKLIKDNDDVQTVFFPDDIKYSFYHSSRDSDKSPADVTIDQVKIYSLDGKNSRGGNKTIVVEMPLTGIDANHVGSCVPTIRTPTGAELSGWPGEITERRVINGIVIVTYKIELNPNHAQGEYMITQMTVSESNSTPQNSNSSEIIVGSDDLKAVNAKTVSTLQRNIKVTVQGTQLMSPSKLKD